MPEARDWLSARLPEGGSPDMSLDFRIRRSSRVATPPQGGAWSPSDGKENIQPESSRSRRRRRLKKSPLPSWYRRTPLRDITHIVRAMERRRSRQRVAAETRMRTQDTLNAAPFPLAQEPSDSEQQDQEPLVSLSELFPDTHGSLKKSSQPAKNLPESSPPRDNLASVEKNIITADKNFPDSIDDFERIVMENIKKSAKKTTNKPGRSTLMSLR